MNFTIPQKNVIETEVFYKNTSISNTGGYILFDSISNTKILEKAINKLIENSDAMRMRVRGNQTDATQEFENYKWEDIEIVELKETDINAYSSVNMRIPFKLNDKLYDFKILKSEEKVGLFVKIHHLIADAWTISLIVTKIVEYYENIENDVAIEKLPLYSDFVEKNDEYIASEQYKKDEEYWKQKYANKPTFVSLSNKKTDYDSSASREKFVITVKERKRIEDYCSKFNISLAVFFEAVVSLYAARINSVDDITLCSLVINRGGAKEKSTIGMFNNILPLTISVDWNNSFVNLCERISEEHYQMFRHQKYPYSKIANIIREEHGQSDIYDIMVSYQNAQISVSKENISKMHWSFNGHTELAFMVNIDDMNNSGELHIGIDYRNNIFCSEEIIKIYNRFLKIISQVLEKEEILFKDIEIITAEEKEEILTVFNDTKKPYPNDKCLYEYLEEAVIKTPEKIALHFGKDSITYKEFNEKVNSLADYIIKNNKVHNAIVGIMLERSFEMLIAIYAINKAGCAYMPMDPHFPTERIAFMLEDSNAPIIITHSKWLNNIPDSVNKVALDEFEYENYNKENPNFNVRATDTAYVIYTSGSTGKPKGAQIPHHSVVNRIKWMHEKYPLCENDVILQKTPYTFDVSVWELFWWSMYGGSLKILIPEGHKDPREIIDAVYDGNVTHMHFVPSMLNAFLEYINKNKELAEKLTSLKYVFASGEALQSEQVRKFYNLLSENKTTLHNLYGPTECTVDVSYYDCDKDNIPDSIPIGKPVDNTQLLVLDKACNLLPIGASGELHISGVLVGKGYINREELTKEKFIENMYYDFPTMYKTGDLASFMPDGNIEYLGRIDNQIKIRGLRVELGDIETAISKYKSVRDVVVTVFEIAGEKNLCAYFTADEKIDTNDLKVEISKNLPDYMVPACFMQLENMPVNNNGKADRKALPKPIIEMEEEYVAPANDKEQKIQECVKNVLKIENISVTTDLISYGLTSLGVITIITDLSAYGWNIKVKDFYENRTIRALSSILESKKEDNYEDDKKYEIVSDIRRVNVDSKEDGNILLTGATGFLGIHLLDELIRKTNKTVYCLIRNEEKFNRYIEKYTTIEKDCSRVIAIKGDITEDYLGLGENVYRKVLDDVSDIIHSAANVSYFCAWEKASSINYHGTCNIIKFAEKAMAKLHHISTMSVSGDILTAQTIDYPKFDENRLYIGQLYKDNVYAHSKYLAEKEVIKAVREMRINASIYRLPNLTWRMSDGLFQENFFENDLYIITRVMQRLEKLPKELADENILLSPIDDLSKAIVKLVCEKKNNDIYHLISTYSPTVEQYIKSLSDVKILPMNEVYEELKKNSEDSQMQFVSMYLAGILQAPEKMVVNINANRTNAILADLGYTWNEIDSEYIKRINKIND